MEICIWYGFIEWLLVLDDYEYIAEQKEIGPRYDSGGEPSFPESIEFNKYHLEIATKGYHPKLINMINNQLLESNKLCDQILDELGSGIYDYALKIAKQLNNLI